jgi:leucine dehydrogenase
MTTSLEDLFHYAEDLNFGDLHIKFDKATGLQAIVAIHNTKRGPALGGCRFIEYVSIDDAIRDALRLARGMSYKSAMANLPLGGGKAVLVKPKNFDNANRETYFTAYARFLNDLGGRYITAMDSGVEITDMDIIARSTPYVTNLSSHNGDPAPFTAWGVLRGIEAAVKFKLGRDNLKDLHIAIQGMGHVGYDLAKRLHTYSAKLTICDPKPALLERYAKELNANVVTPDKVYDIECDVFSPCALGAILNDNTIPRLKTPIIAGSANNQLAEPRHGQMLADRGILYAPDYVISAGGLIHAYAEYNNASFAEAEQHIVQLYDTLLTVFERAAKENKPPSIIADIMAAERL